MAVMEREIAKLNERLDLVEEKVQKLEVEQKEGTINPGTKLGKKPKDY